MAMRKNRTFGDPVLRTPYDPTVDMNDDVRSLVDDLLETVDGDGRGGRSANPIGIGLQSRGESVSSPYATRICRSGRSELANFSR
jgi:peptide deformylase